MFKFFRRIRHQLLLKAKLRKYLIYAVGEIVLVVIGILIALQINNWNSKRKEISKEQVILAQLKDEYTSNLKQLEEKMEMRDRIISSGLILLQYIDNPAEVTSDSLIFHFSNIIFDPTFDPIQNDLISSGNIRLIRNDKLRQLLSNWTSDIIAVQEQEKTNHFHAHEIMQPLFNKLGITRLVLNEVWLYAEGSNFLLDKDARGLELDLAQNQNDIQVKDILAHTELEGVVSGAISYNKVGNIQSVSLKKRINKILELINLELNKNNNG